MIIVYIGTGYIQVLYLGRASRTKETLPDFHEWRRVTRHPLVFRGLTGSQSKTQESRRHRLHDIFLLLLGQKLLPLLCTSG